MKRFITLIALSTLVAAAPAMAQGNSHKKDHSKNRDEHKSKDRVVVVDRTRGNDVTVTRTTTQKSGSPAFCRSGAGHPKFGRAWCVDKGFGLGDNGWNRSVWNDVVFRTQRSPTIGDVLSSVVLGRLTNYTTSTLGLRTPLYGNWVTSDTGSRVYLVRSGSTQVAEFVDTNRDGRADYVLLHQR